MKLLKLLAVGILSLAFLGGCSAPDQKTIEKTEDYAKESVHEAFNEFGEEASKSADQTTKMQNEAMHGSPKKNSSLEEKALEIVE